MRKILIIIPARYKSSRFPGKPLKKILGRELVLRVADRCKKISNKRDLIIATDNSMISKVAKKENFEVIMTSRNCLTGTDRVAEVAKRINSKIYINVQGDEPLVNPKDIKKIISQKNKYPNHIICGFAKIRNFENPASKNIPKVVMNKNNELVYISRALVPSSKKKSKIQFYKQVCIYAFNKMELAKFSSKKKKSALEKLEDIEILRFFDLGIKIKMVKLSSKTLAVDVKSDIKKVEKFL